MIWYEHKSFGVLKKKNFKECSMNSFLKKIISHYGSIFAQGVMIRANLNLNYKRTLTNHGFAVLKKIFKNVPMYFLCETQIPNCGPPLPWGVMIWTTSNIHYQRILSFHYDQSQLSCSCEDDFSYICLCSILITHATPRSHDFNKLESTFPEDASTWVSAFQAQWFLRWKSLTYAINFLLIHNYLPLE